MQKRWRFISHLQQSLVACDEGQGLTEYALIILLFAIALVGAVTGFGDALVALYGQIIAGAF